MSQDEEKKAEDNLAELHISVIVNADGQMSMPRKSRGFSPLELRGLADMIKEQIAYHSEEVANKAIENPQEQAPGMQIVKDEDQQGS